MAAGRKPTTPAVQQGPDFVTETPTEQATQELIARDLVRSGALTPAETIAKHLGYTGTLTVESLEQEIRFYQRRSIEAVLETGKRLLLLKEVTGHGGFIESLERLGFGARLAQQFMAATLKFSNTKSTSLLAQPNLNQGKLLELLVLDDEEIEGLNNGESICGITLDDVDCMSVSELRRAMRQSRADKEAELAKANAEISGSLAAKDRLIADGKKRIAELVEEKNRRESMTDSERDTELERALAEASLIAIGATIPLRKAVDSIRAIDHHSQGLYVAIQGALHRVLTEVESIAADYAISLDIGLPELETDAADFDNANAGEEFPAGETIGA